MFASYILQEFDASILVTTPSVPYKGWSLITQSCNVFCGCCLLSFSLSLSAVFKDGSEQTFLNPAQVSGI